MSFLLKLNITDPTCKQDVLEALETNPFSMMFDEILQEMVDTDPDIFSPLRKATEIEEFLTDSDVQNRVEAARETSEALRQKATQKSLNQNELTAAMKAKLVTGFYDAQATLHDEEMGEASYFLQEKGAHIYALYGLIVHDEMLLKPSCLGELEALYGPTDIDPPETPQLRR